MKKLSGPLFVLSASLLSGCTTVHPAHDTITQWEYQIAPPDHMRSETPAAFLNRLGKEGWVLVQKDANGQYYFKRPIKAGKD